MAERFKAAVLKTAVRETVPGVRIPLPPPRTYLRCEESFRGALEGDIRQSSHCVTAPIRLLAAVGETARLVLPPAFFDESQ